jgi:hypothetical protein
VSFFEFPHTRTYDSDLGWLISEVEKISKEYQDIYNWMNTHEADYLLLLERVTTLEGEVNGFINDINQRFDELKNGLEAYIYEQVQQALGELILELGALEAAIIQLRLDLQSEITEIRSGYMAADTALKFWLEARLEQVRNEIPDLTTVNVWNPVRGAITSIQVCVNDLYDISRTGALTAYEYDSMELTAAEYDALDLSAYDYDNFARDILGRTGMFKNPYYYMYSPFTGEYVPITTVINELAFLHRSDALTAAEYDALSLTAADYDAEDITAYDYDWNGKTILI